MYMFEDLCILRIKHIMIVHPVHQNLPHYMNMYKENDLHSFVSEFQDLKREQVFDLEDSIMKKLTVSCALLPL